MSQVLERLFAELERRKASDPKSSYTAQLLQSGRLRIAKKLGEEAIETVLAAVGEDKAAVISESADLLYHLLVLWLACDVAPAEVYAALEARSGQSGLAEKAARTGQP
jgi:phosphoribosyl-ATP pyrophosphohydrolase